MISACKLKRMRVYYLHSEWKKAKGEEQFCFQCSNIKHSQAKATEVLFEDLVIVGASVLKNVDGISQKAEASS